MSATQLVQSQFEVHETLAPKNKTRVVCVCVCVLTTEVGLSEQGLFFSVFVWEGMCMYVPTQVHMCTDQRTMQMSCSVTLYFNPLNLEFTIFS